MITLSNLGILRNTSATRHPFRTLRTMLRVANERHALKNLPADRLRDIGRTAHEAEVEANRTLWDVPNHWRR